MPYWTLHFFVIDLTSKIFWLVYNPSLTESRKQLNMKTTFFLPISCLKSAKGQSPFSPRKRFAVLLTLRQQFLNIINILPKMSDD